MFLEIQLDKDVSYGAEGGPVFQTVVITTPSRQEQRIQQNSRHYRSYKVMLHDKTLVAIQALESMFIAAQGKTNGFRFKDNREYKATLEPLSNYAGGLTVQLIKTYGAAYGRAEVRPIRKPQENITAITLYRDGSPTAWSRSGNWSVDDTSGVVTFNTDQTGHTFTWSGEFDVPVRFDTDVMNPLWEEFGRIHWDSVPLVEIVV